MCGMSMEGKVQNRQGSAKTIFKQEELLDGFHDNENSFPLHHNLTVIFIN